MVHVEQIRIPSRRHRRRWKKDYQVQDVSLERIESSVELVEASDLSGMGGLVTKCESFTTEDIARVTDRPRWFAQKIAYVLKHTDAIEQIGRKRSGIIYRAA